MTGAEPPIIVTTHLTGFLTKWNATKMRTNTNQNQIFRLFSARCINLRVTQIIEVRVICTGDFISGTMADKHRLAAPFHSDRLANSDFRNINFDIGKRQSIGSWVQLINQWPSNCSGTKACHRIGRHNDKIATSRFLNITFSGVFVCIRFSHLVLFNAVFRTCYST